VVKDNLFSVPPLFELIQQESSTPWQEMYKVFNMGHRMEIYCDEKTASEIISVSKSFNIAAQVVGRVENSDAKKLTVKTPGGEFIYHE
jgi:phosphoribosylformylglycinamidine cyclo-ligase